jgi:hypothetical protein
MAAIPPAPVNPVDELLQIVGFADPEERQALITEVFPDLKTISLYTERDLKDIVKEFRSCTIAAGRITITCVTMSRTLGLICWVQDAYRCDQDPVPANFTNAEIETANRRAEVHAALLEQSETVAKSAQPKKLKGEQDWHEWFDSLKNYLSLLMGTNGVPLSYVIRDHVEPAPDANFNTYEEEVYALAPLLETTMLHTRKENPLKSGSVRLLAIKTVAVTYKRSRLTFKVKVMQVAALLKPTTSERISTTRARKPIASNYSSINCSQCLRSIRRRAKSLLKKLRFVRCWTR